MVHTLGTRSTVRLARDAAVGFGLFAVCTVLALGPSAAGELIAGGAALPVAGSPLLLAKASGVGHPTAMVWVLAAVFSALFALNIAFIRHLHRTHRRTLARAKSTRLVARSVESQVERVDL